MVKFFPTEELLNWFKAQKRDLPWRKEPSFYEVLISEFMLQQTVVVAVIPYFESWMKKFPNLLVLANADAEEVMKSWEGLGYYSRARNLHKIAKTILEDNKKIPTTYKELISLKGIGDYTAKAILAFAYKEPVIAVDGNVLRVGARLLGIQESIKLPRIKNEIQSFFDAVKKEDGTMAEALIELGACICKRTPNCLVCPLKITCKAYLNELTSVIPKKEKRKEITKLHSNIVVCSTPNKVLVVKRASDLMKDLYEFPKQDEIINQNLFNDETIILRPIKRHYTRFCETLYPKFFKSNDEFLICEGIWIDKNKLQDLPFSSGHRKIKEIILKNFTNENSSY